MSRIRFGIVLLGSLAVGGTFVAAGALKSLDVDGFARDIALHGILGPGLASVLARALVPFEIVVGAAVILGYRRRAGLVLLIGALLLFSGATAYAWSTGHTEGCGCFGRFAARTPLAVILEDLALIGAGAAAWMAARGVNPSSAAATRSAYDSSRSTGGASSAGGPRAWRAPLLAGLAVLCTAFTLASPHLPIDNYATALRPGVQLSDLGLDRIAGDLAEGERLLVILVLDEQASRDAIAMLNALSEQPGVPRITALTTASEEARAEIFWTYAPQFEFLEVPAADFRRLYRRAPRAFLSQGGAVRRIWEGVPPAQDLTRSSAAPSLR